MAPISQHFFGSRDYHSRNTGYNANWESAGRWGIEVDMEDKKLILRPLEKFIDPRQRFFGSVICYVTG